MLIHVGSSQSDFCLTDFIYFVPFFASSVPLAQAKCSGLNTLVQSKAQSYSASFNFALTHIFNLYSSIWQYCFIWFTVVWKWFANLFCLCLFSYDSDYTQAIFSYAATECTYMLTASWLFTEVFKWCLSAAINVMHKVTCQLVFMVLILRSHLWSSAQPDILCL